MSDLFDGVKWRIPEWFPDISKDKLEQLTSYHREIVEFNAKLNLISPRSVVNADRTHFADCILGTDIIYKDESPKEIYDLGSGNGFPGLIIAILHPETRVYGVESDARKAEFLRHCAHKVGATNFVPIHARAEQLKEGSIHFAVSRGFASISKALLLIRKSAAPNCRYFHFKTRSWSKEVAEIPAQIIAFWEPVLVKDYTLPDKEAELSLVLTKRI